MRSLKALLLACVAGVSLAGQSAPQSGGWESYNGDLQGRRYSPLAQINRGNVARLKLAWRYGAQAPASGGPTVSAASQAIPIVVRGVLYTPTAQRSIVALDPATGREIWKHDLGNIAAPNRGVSYWPGDGTLGPRILAGLGDGRLLALDAATGAPIASFGEGGAINLRAGVGDKFPNMPYLLPSPGIVYRNLIITGARGQEGIAQVPGHGGLEDSAEGKVRVGIEQDPPAAGTHEKSATGKQARDCEPEAVGLDDGAPYATPFNAAEGVIEKHRGKSNGEKAVPDFAAILCRRFGHRARRPRRQAFPRP